jgi:small redox-active disulfide protein 2
MRIQIAGPGCQNCATTERNVFNACAELNLDADISHVRDYGEIAKLGVVRTPAVVIDGRIEVMGRVPAVSELKALLVNPRSAAEEISGKKLEVFDPPMCCSTGVCGPNVDPALVRFASDVNWLVSQGVAVDRYNLAQQPQAYAANAAVKAALAEHGTGCLPLLLWNGAVVSQGRYPAREELAKLAGIEPGKTADLPILGDRCCG